MRRLLVTYASLAGSTGDVASAVGEELVRCGAQVDVLPLAQVKSLEGYDGVIIGAPMIMGWHRDAVRFLKRNRAAWQRIPLAVFVTAMSLTRTGDTSVGGVPVCIDENLPKAPVQADRLTLHERYSLPAHYLQPILKAARPARPTSIGMFGGRLEYGRLPWWAVLFAMLIIRAPAGDRRNWPAIRSWAASLATAFVPEPAPDSGQLAGQTGPMAVA